jgi:hypothetical protein
MGALLEKFNRSGEDQSTFQLSIYHISQDYFSKYQLCKSSALLSIQMTRLDLICLIVEEFQGVWLKRAENRIENVHIT